MVNPSMAMMPGRPSVRGFLYQPSYWLQYKRLKSLHPYQRTETEMKTYFAVSHPDTMLMFYTVCPMYFFWCCYFFTGHPMGMIANKDRTQLGAMNQSERWKRNSDLAQLFDYHKDLVAEMRAKAGPRPKIFAPPTDDIAPWKDTQLK